MFDGDLWTEGSPILSNFVFLAGFFTLVLSAAQEDDIIIPTLDIFHTFISWPNFNEGVIITFCLWCFRNIERILGIKVLVQFLFYNLISYLPLFITTIILKGFRSHFSFLFFVPFSLYIFIVWQIPSVKLFSVLTDKIAISLAFIFLVCCHFPFSLFPLISAIIGNIIWSFDVFRLKKCTQEPVDEYDNTIDDIHVSINDLEDSQENLDANPSANRDQRPNIDAENRRNDIDANSDAVKSIIDMGFSRDQAILALSQCDNDVQRAVNKLLS
ncbi:hypothetical protein M9Y10_025593 [Tritrichomonas musculus]|uniref:UBA domain-containing protein n=1 Tax=Tritrichomonas musculus TaxID=1915356 RepID=A0ABR2H942_9EUKA